VGLEDSTHPTELRNQLKHKRCVGNGFSISNTPSFYP
jgi:hypothetical protein